LELGIHAHQSTFNLANDLHREYDRLVSKLWAWGVE
jgi:hypothetical protein